MGLCLGATIVSAQRVSVKLADKKFNNFAYADAARYYQFSYKKDSANTYALRQLIKCNHRMGDYKKENQYYDELIKSGEYQRDDLYNYYRVLKANGKYRDAEKWFNKYKASDVEGKDYYEVDSLVESIQRLKSDSLRYRIQSVDINSSYSDMAPAFMGDKLVFTSARDSSLIIRRRYRWNNSPYLELYSADIDPEGKLSNPKPLSKKIGTRFHEGGMSFSKDLQKMYFTRNNLEKGRKMMSSDKVLNLGIYEAEMGEKGWNVSREFPFNSKEYSIGHPSLEGGILYFASDMPGGFGGTDIYRSRLDSNGWSMPENLGAKINTRENEIFPHISSDGMLFFATEGRGGMGGLDIFAATPKGADFEAVENMGYPLNSSMDDFGFIVDESGKKGYLSSNRGNIASNDDLYFVYLDKIPVNIKGSVLDAENLVNLSEAKVFLISDQGDTLKSFATGKNGEFRFSAEKGKNYMLTAIRKDYFPGEAEVSTKGALMNSTLLADILLTAKPEPLKIEGDMAIVRLEAIHYDFDKSDIRSDAEAILDELIVYLNEHPELEIRLESHTDCRGTHAYNMKLSHRRAASAFNYLVNGGIDIVRLETKGFGETQILNRCVDGIKCTEAEHAINRRTMIKVVRKHEPGK